MRKFVPFVAVAALVAAAPVQAQGNPCTINSTTAPAFCTVSSSFAMTMPALMSMGLDVPATTLTPPANVGAFNGEGKAFTTDDGPVITVRSNRSYKIAIKANAATFSHTAQAGAAEYAKPVGDVLWTIDGANYTALTTADVQIGLNQSATSSREITTLAYKTNFDITKDQPGIYNLALTFTLTAP